VPAFAVNAASFGLSAVLVLRVRLPRQARAATWHPVRELREGLSYSVRTPVVRGVFVVIGAVMVSSAIKGPAEPGFVFQHLHGDTQTLGLVTALWGVGMVVGVLLAPGAVRAWRRESLLTAGIGLAGLCLLAASRAQAVAPVLMLYLVAGSANGIGAVCYETLLQEHTPDALRGRVLAACNAVLDVALLGGYVLAGVLGDHVLPPSLFAVAGCVFVGAAVLGRMLLGERAAGSVTRHQVDHAQQVLVLGKTANVLPDALGQGTGSHARGVGRVWREQAARMGPEWMAFGQRFGVRHVEGGTTDPALVQGPHQVGGDDVPAPGHVHQPGVVGHGPQLGGGDDALGLGGQGEGDDDTVSILQGLMQAVVAEGADVEAGRCPTCEWVGLAADDGCLHAKGAEEAEQLGGDPAGPEDGDPAADERAAGRFGPGRGPGPFVELAEAGQ
jgi:MFS family permease